MSIPQFATKMSKYHKAAAFFLSHKASDSNPSFDRSSLKVSELLSASEGAVHEYDLQVGRKLLIIPGVTAQAVALNVHYAHE
jgi:hypothetical protein